MQSQTVSEYNPKTGETTKTSTIFEGELTGTWITVKDARGSILRMENNVHDPNYEMMQDNEWTYDDTERTAVGMAGIMLFPGYSGKADDAALRFLSGSVVSDPNNHCNACGFKGACSLKDKGGCGGN